VLIEGAFDIDVPRDVLFQTIVDHEFMAACIPGCEAIERLGPADYRAVVAVGLGSIKARFNLLVQITEQSPPDSIRSVTRGEEGGRASQLVSNNEVSLVDLNGRTLLRYRSDVTLSGRLGKFALGVLKKKAQSLSEQFANALRQKIADRLPAGATPA
jgi:carbon monoxide dehydrogenase subunit G